MTDLEELLDKWQTKLCEDVERGISIHYAYPAIVKYLMIEFQEYLYTLQKVVKNVEPSVKVDVRNSNTVNKSTTKLKKSNGESPTKNKPPPEKKLDPIMHWEHLNAFKDKAEFVAYQQFLTNYIAFNSNVMETLLSIATLTHFGLVPVQHMATRQGSTTNFTSQPEGDKESMNTQQMNEESIQRAEWKSKGAHLPILKKRLKKSAVSLVLRLHKTTRALLYMFPGAQNYQQTSVFDKSFLLNVLLSSNNWSDHAIEEEVQRRTMFELEADKLLAEGGINSKSVTEITETAKRIKEQMDIRINDVINDQTVIEPKFFIQSRALYKLWKDVFREKYAVNSDIFKQAFSFKYGEGILTESRMEGFKKLVNQNRQAQEFINSPKGRLSKNVSLQSAGSRIASSNNIQIKEEEDRELVEDLTLYDLVNLTDFINITDAFGMFEIDRLQFCDDAVRQENSKNYAFELRELEQHNLEESLRAKHLTKEIKTTKTGNKTLFVRSKMTVTSNPKLLLTLYIFGMQTVHQNSRKVLNKLSSSLGPKNSAEMYDSSKLYGLYRSHTNQVARGAGTLDENEYYASAFGGLQRLLNSNEAALDIMNDMQPSLGQKMDEYNIVSQSMTNQSQLILNREETLPSELGQLSKQFGNNIDSQASIPVGEEATPGGGSQKSVSEQNQIKNRYLRYCLEDPGFLVTFDQQAEVYDLLVHDDIQTIIFQLVGDKSFPDAKDTKPKTPGPAKYDMKKPYFVSGYEVESASGGKLYQKLFELRSPDSTEEGQDAKDLDLLLLKDIVRESYNLCNFSAKATIWEASQARRRMDVQRKYLTLFSKMCAISIDGYKRDRYMIKIEDMKANVAKAQAQLQEEERNIQESHVPPDELPAALENITRLLLQVETLINEKTLLMEKLEKKQSKWRENDQVFKERKTTLRDVLKIGMALVTDLSRYEGSNESDVYRRLGDHEGALFLIDEIFIRNRVRSVVFMAQVQNLIEIKKEALNDLGQTQIELASKIQFIEEEQIDMQKQRLEMLSLGEKKLEKEGLEQANQEQEQRINNMRNALGLGKNYGKSNK